MILFVKHSKNKENIVEMENSLMVSRDWYGEVGEVSEFDYKGVLFGDNFVP